MLLHTFDTCTAGAVFQSLLKAHFHFSGSIHHHLEAEMNRSPS